MLNQWTSICCTSFSLCGSWLTTVHLLTLAAFNSDQRELCTLWLQVVIAVRLFEVKLPLHLQNVKYLGEHLPIFTFSLQQGSFSVD